MSAVPRNALLLTPESYRKIDREVAKFPPEHKASAVMVLAAEIASIRHGQTQTAQRPAIGISSGKNRGTGWQLISQGFLDLLRTFRV